MTSYTPIDCSDYDVLELVCIRRYKLEIVLDDKTVIGAALTLKAESDAEYLIVR